MNIDEWYRRRRTAWMLLWLLEQATLCCCLRSAYRSHFSSSKRPSLNSRPTFRPPTASHTLLSAPRPSSSLLQGRYAIMRFRGHACNYAAAVTITSQCRHQQWLHVYSESHWQSTHCIYAAVVYQHLRFCIVGLDQDVMHRCKTTYNLSMKTE